MASPPFSLTTSVPGNNDIAANFPSLNRSDKDVIQSWLSVQWNSQGHSIYTLIDQVGSVNGPISAPTPSAGTIGIYYDTDTVLKQYSGDTAQVEVVGVPSGTVLDFAGSTLPAGYLLCSGQAVSRTTYSRLFAVIGSTWGNGDGSTTFNVPDLRGRATFGKDNMGGSTAGRITVAGGNFDGTVLGNTGGSQGTTLVQANLPNVTFTVSIASGQGSHAHAAANTNTPQVFSGTSATFQAGASASAPVNMSTITTGTATLPAMTGTAASGGTGTAAASLSPGAIVNKIIKI